MKSKKIGILTIPLNNNYGGILQSYALNKTLRDYGYETVVLLPTCHSVKEYIKKVADYISPASCFIRKNINVLYIDYNNIYSEIEKHSIDTVVIGSDQVWRPEFMNVKLSFCVGFDFTKIKVLSYAASFGFDQWIYNSEETAMAKKAIGSFAGISVREDSAVELCKNFLSAKAQHVLDPTMLVEKAQYISMCKQESNKYIFCYLLGYTNNNNLEVVNSAQKQLGIKVKHIYLTRNKFLKRFRFNESIQKWLSLIYNSQLIITDSFHGTVFSIIFNRPFYVLQNKKGGNSRILSLLKIFGLENRMITSWTNIGNEDINWEHVNSILKKWKKDSITFLNKTLYD